MPKAKKIKIAFPKTKAQIISVFAVIVAVASLVGVGVLYKNNQDLKSNPKTLQKAQTEESNQLKQKVSKLIDLPKDESATVATVEDKDKLKDQPFFKDAQNGDKLLIFPQAKKAVLYREKDNRLINVGPIAVTGDQKAAVKKVKLLTFRADTETKASLSKISGIEITQAETAKGRNYTKPQVYDAKGDAAGAKQIADAIGGEVVATLPNGETQPGDDVNFVVVATK